jgi:hypothetical protein
MRQVKERELLFKITRKDFDIKTFRSGGPGGQHQNKTDSGVRIVHRESGAVGESRSEKSQLTNKKLAFERLVESPKFRVWLNGKVIEAIEGKTIEQRVEEQMKPDKLKIEVVNEQGQWTEAV